MQIIPQFAPIFPTLSPPLLTAPQPRLALPAPKIAGLLPAPRSVSLTLPKRAVPATIANPILLIDDPKAKWAEFQRIYGPDRTREEMDAELDAVCPGYVAYMRQKMAAARGSVAS